MKINFYAISKNSCSGLVLASGFSVAQTGSYEWKNSYFGYTYKYVSNDPVKARFYTLKKRTHGYFKSN